MHDKIIHHPFLLHGLFTVMAMQSLNGCALYVSQEKAENESAMTRVESTTPVRQWPVKDPYVVNHGGKVQVIPDERYEPRPSKK